MGGKQYYGTTNKQVWGSCLFNHRPRRPGNVCQYPTSSFEWPKYVGWWHIPPSFFPLMGTDPYRHADIFVVVRDVKDRLVSEYYYVCRKKINKTTKTSMEDCNRTRISDPTYLNEWIEMKLQQRSSSSTTTKKDTPPTMMSAEDYLYENGHFTPQSHFIVTPKTHVRYAEYVLRLDDSLGENFQLLMRAYGMHVRSPPTKTNTVRNETTDLQGDGINSRVDELLHQRYQQDFDIYNAALP
jgi:hypothetical protein